MTISYLQFSHVQPKRRKTMTDFPAPLERPANTSRERHEEWCKTTPGILSYCLWLSLGLYHMRQRLGRRLVRRIPWSCIMAQEYSIPRCSDHRPVWCLCPQSVRKKFEPGSAHAARKRKGEFVWFTRIEPNKGKQTGHQSWANRTLKR